MLQFDCGQLTEEARGFAYNVFKHLFLKCILACTHRLYPGI
jgi:hypothetical protein